MKDIAIQDPSSYLISPLPKFSNALPAMFDSFATLPDLAADMDETHSDSTDEESDEEVHTPDSLQQQLRPSAAREIRASFAPEPVQPSRAPPRGTLAPSGLSRTAPHREHRRERSCSNPNPSPSASRSHSPFDSIASATPLPAVQITNHSTSSSRETYASPLSQEGVNPRLRDILTHNTSSPSSLPIFSANHFPSSLKRDGSAAQRDDRPHAGSSRSSEPLVTPQANGSSSKTPRSTSPNRPVSTRMSSASAEAKKLEDEKRRRYLEEKYGAEGERQPVEPERDPSRWYNVPSNLSNTLNTVIGTSSASQAARSREQQQQQQPPPYANPNPTLTSMPTLKRSSTTGANYVNSKASTLLPPASSIPAGTDGIQMGRVQGSKSAPKSLLVNPTTYP
ncbi:hypothetical protein BDN70DRAFT_406222 [Pholiota conissans]|uniref:Uncharacterized protein n=1 Tax=Pholiota conissans TaxID=109636 RepID=A0A9P5YR23_9AGAR|nr:hypothetical protein BDN70DRAFT_406222 [Pholiota conissans]